MFEIKKIHLGDVKKLACKRPLIAVLFCIALLALVTTVFEYARAWHYMNQADDFVNSARLQTLRSDIDRLNRSADAVASAQFCELRASDLLADFNSAYISISTGENDPQIIVEKLRKDIDQLDYAPSYRTFVPFGGLIEDAKVRSTGTKEALTSLRQLLKQDARSDYCISVQEALARVYFAQTLRKPEGVSALLPGQIENFQTNTRQAVDALTNVRYPVEFSEVHSSLVKTVSDMQLTLTKNTNNYVAFAREVDDELNIIESNLASIKERTKELQAIPANLALSVADIR